jgi:hypothetical protein
MEILTLDNIKEVFIQEVPIPKPFIPNWVKWSCGGIVVIVIWLIYVNSQSKKKQKTTLSENAKYKKEQEALINVLCRYNPQYEVLKKK